MASEQIAQDGATDADHPGRWLGGAIGVLVSIGAAGLATAWTGYDDARSGLLSFTVAQIALLGSPIAWILGRSFFPMARSRGGLAAMRAAALVAVVAPPLGAVEILAGYGLIERAMPGFGSPSPGLSTLVLLPIAIPFSYVGLIVTAPVAMVWAVIVRLVPDDLPARLRAPRRLERIGTRYLLAVVTIAVFAIQVVELIGR